VAKVIIIAVFYFLLLLPFAKE